MNYNNLKTQIQNTFDDEDTEFTDSIPDFISRAELRLTRELDSRGLTEYATSSFTANEPWLVLPSNLLIIRNVNYINSEGSRISLLL
ncbi:MAG TPA: hypothetical protein DCS66_07855, partial [Flavobacteriaceae bacterium]|nr:hypothetical protein [Flavobacteriaceae bacterium]